MKALLKTVRMLVVAGLLAGAAMTTLSGCDNTDGAMPGADLPMVGGYGPIDSDVFQNAANDWSEYIRQ